MLFRYCVPKAVSSTEFYPIPYYESVYLENQCFTIEADSQYQADEKAYRFLANLQKKHDLAYEKLLDEQLTDHQFAYGLVFLLIVVLLILLLPQFRGLGMLDVLNLD